jgi:hypothetical protein
MVKLHPLRIVWQPMAPKSGNYALLIFLMTLMLPVDIWSQEGDIQWIPLEVPQLSRSEVQWLDAVTRYSDAPLFAEAVGFLEEQVYGGEISSGDRAAVQLLERIALSPYSERYTGPRPATALVPLRSRAVQLLGYIGGEYSLDAVDRIVAIETDDSVLSAVFFVYREIAPPFNEYRSEEFARILRRATLISPSDRLVRTIIAAVRSMHERTWSMNSQTLFDAILGVVQSGLSFDTKSQALALARLIAGVEIEGD